MTRRPFLSHESREVSLTGSELSHGADAISRRVRELERRLDRTSYEGKPGMKDQVVLELSILRSLAEKLAAAGEAVRLSEADAIRVALGFGEALSKRLATEPGQEPEHGKQDSEAAFKPTHRYRATFGDPSVLVQVVLFDPPLAYGREAIVRFEDDPREVRVSTSSLIELDACSCEFEDDGDGESGPHLVQHIDPSCPEHGAEATR